MRRALVPLAVVGVALAVALPVWWFLSPPAVPIRIGDVAPDFSLPHYNQRASRGTLAELRGSPVLLVRFDSRWAGSPAYLVELERVHRRYLRDGLVVVGVALDSEVEERAMEFVLSNRSISYTVLLDPDGRVTNPLYGRLQRKAVTYVIDTAGRLVDVRFDLPLWTGPPLLLYLSRLLPTPTPSPQPLDTPPASR